MSGSCPVGADVCREAHAELERLRAGIKALIVEPDDPDDDDVRLRNYYYALRAASYLLDVAAEHLAALLNPTEGENR